MNPQPPRTKNFSGGFGLNTVNLVSDPACVGGEAAELVGIFVRSGRPSWSMFSHICPASIVRTSGQTWSLTFSMCSGPVAGLQLGNFSLTALSGNVLTGTPSVQVVGTVYTFTMAVAHATREFTGGVAHLTMDAEVPQSLGTVSGYLQVG